jgi:hypothetical protein
MTMEEEVFERGVKIGYEIGLAICAHLAHIDTARKLLKRDFAWEVITEITGVCPEDLN